MKCITYKSGYKYQLKQSYSLAISIVPAATITTEFIELTGGGALTINRATLGTAHLGQQ